MYDHPFSIALVFACAAVVAVKHARPWLDTLRARWIATRADHARQPGGLYRDNTWPEVDEWEAEHVNDALTLAGQPSLEDIDCAMWELELSGLPVYDVPDEGWGDL